MACAAKAGSPTCMWQWTQASRSQAIGTGPSGMRSEAITNETAAAAAPRTTMAKRSLRTETSCAPALEREDLDDRGLAGGEEAGGAALERHPALLEENHVVDEVPDLLQPVRAEDQRRRRRDLAV